MMRERLHRLKRNFIKFFQHKFSVEYEQTCILPDKIYIKRKYRKKMGRKLHLRNPQRFSEKLQWLKLYDRRPEYTVMVDKYLVKSYVAQMIGEEHVIPTYGVWDRAGDIDFEQLPDRFVLKTNHDSGGAIICRDKNHFDFQQARDALNDRLQTNFYLHAREWPYKHVVRKIIAEKYLCPPDGEDLKDYKFFCFNGKVKAMFIVSGRNHDTRMDYFDENFHVLPFENGFPRSEVPPQKPLLFDKMIEIAERLSADITHVRVDMYELAGQIYFGEMTFFDGSGWTPFEPDEWDRILGDWITLPRKKRR